MGKLSLIINPGSTSTKIGVFEDEKLLFDETLRHSTEEIAKWLRKKHLAIIFMEPLFCVVR